MAPGKRTRPGRILSAQVSDGGAERYPLVKLCAGDRRRVVRVHVLVAEAFHGARPDGLEVDHRDRDKLNARAGNLRYVTHAENMANVVFGGAR